MPSGDTLRGGTCSLHSPVCREQDLERFAAERVGREPCSPAGIAARARGPVRQDVCVLVAILKVYSPFRTLALGELARPPQPILVQYMHAAAHARDALLAPPRNVRLTAACVPLRPPALRSPLRPPRPTDWNGCHKSGAVLHCCGDKVPESNYLIFGTALAKNHEQSSEDGNNHRSTI